MNLKRTSASLGSDEAKIPASKTAFRSPLLHDAAWLQIKAHNIASFYFFEIGAISKVFSIKANPINTIVSLVMLLLLLFDCNVQTSCPTSLIINLPCAVDRFVIKITSPPLG